MNIYTLLGYIPIIVESNINDESNNPGMTAPNCSSRSRVFADLHVHTTLSDGRDSPQEVVKKALQMGLKAIAITDHDTVVGIKDVMRAADGTSLRIIPGIEMSTEGGRHLVGLFIDTNCKEISEFSDFMRKSRADWAKKVVTNLEEKGIASISFNDLMEKVGKGVVGKPQIATMAFDTYDKVKVKQFIETNLNKDMPAYVSKKKKTMEECISIVIKAGGIPVLAHPCSHKSKKVDDLDQLAAAGLKGIEIHYPDQTPKGENYHLKLAEELGLAISGGSDHHDGDGLGEYGVTEEEFMKLEGLVR